MLVIRRWRECRSHELLLVAMGPAAQAVNRGDEIREIRGAGQPEICLTWLRSYFLPEKFSEPLRIVSLALGACRA